LAYLDFRAAARVRSGRSENLRSGDPRRECFRPPPKPPTTICSLAAKRRADGIALRLAECESNPFPNESTPVGPLATGWYTKRPRFGHYEAKEGCVSSAWEAATRKSENSGRYSSLSQTSRAAVPTKFRTVMCCRDG